MTSVLACRFRSPDLRLIFLVPEDEQALGHRIGV
jgi:hypothetical protein